ncbi:MAG: YHS domain-containing (seleno)protein [Alphaproteobacteria bacterium]
MKMTSIFAAASLAALLVGAAVPALAADEFNIAPGLSAAGKPVGMHGSDPVALVTTSRSVTGSATNTVIHEGIAYYFSNAENANTFKASPARYLPQNNGFCTFGVSVGKKFDGDPRYSAVVDGKLYVFLNEEIYNNFLKDRAGTISKAAANWPRIMHTAATAL